MAANQKQFLREVEVDRVVNLLLVNLVEQLYENKFEWEMLQKGVEETLDVKALETFQLPENWPFQVIYLLKLNPQHEKDFEDGHSKHILNVMITFASKDKKQEILDFPFELFIDRTIVYGGAPPTKEKNEEGSNASQP